MINIKQKCFLRFLLRVYVKEVSLKLITGIVLKEEKKKKKATTIILKEQRNEITNVYSRKAYN